MSYPTRLKSQVFRMAAGCVAGLLVPLQLAGIPFGVEWTRLPDLSDAARVKGYFVLDHGQIHLLMGGSAFPTPPSKGGHKVYSDRIYLLDMKTTGHISWQELPVRLPVPVAGGISMQVKDGAVLAGGQNQNGILDQVLRLTWNPGNSLPVIKDLPTLPQACFYPAGIQWNNRLYLAGGCDGTEGLATFWMLDMNAAEAGWEALPAWPGPPLFGSILQVLNDGERDYLYLFSGKSRNTFPRSQSNYSRAVYRFDPVTKDWQKLRDMPRAALLGIPLKAGASDLMILGGSDGHDIERLDEIMDTYRLPSDILQYSAKTDTWQIAGKMPIGLAGATLFTSGGDFILVGGEYAPARRTNKAWFIRVQQEIPE